MDTIPPLQRRTNSVRLRWLVPPSATALAAASRTRAAFSATVSSPIAAATCPAIASAPTVFSSSPSQLQLSTHTPSPARATTRAFTRWSANLGHASTGTPARRRLRHRWLTNRPTAGCRSTSPCSTHDLVTIPRPPCTRRRKPSSSSPRRSPSSPASSLSTTAPFTTHRNLWPHASSPAASSLICSFARALRLPKLTYTTDRGGCASSHAM
nr:unnamed protein product [Digitaria exilis]